MLVQIDYHIHFTTPFHLGTGISTSALDRTVVRNAQGFLYIPASTFKGVLREQCEHLLRLYAPTQNVVSPHEADKVLGEFTQAPNLISRIFGSQLHPGGLRFDNIELEGQQSYKNLQTSVLTQVRIDRLVGTAVDQALYSSEFGNPIFTFTGKIKGQLHCPPIADLALQTKESTGITSLRPSCSLLLLLAGMLLVERLGGNKSTGKGACQCKIIQLLLDGHKCSAGDENEQGWRFWLEYLDQLSAYLQKEQGTSV